MILVNQQSKIDIWKQIMEKCITFHNENHNNIWYCTLMLWHLNIEVWVHVHLRKNIGDYQHLQLTDYPTNLLHGSLSEGLRCSSQSVACPPGRSIRTDRAALRQRLSPRIWTVCCNPHLCRSQTGSCGVLLGRGSGRTLSVAESNSPVIEKCD